MPTFATAATWSEETISTFLFGLSAAIIDSPTPFPFFLLSDDALFGIVSGGFCHMNPLLFGANPDFRVHRLRNNRVFANLDLICPGAALDISFTFCIPLQCGELRTGG